MNTYDGGWGRTNVVVYLFLYTYIHYIWVEGIQTNTMGGGDGQLQWGTDKFYKGGRTHTIIYTDTNNIQYSWGGGRTNNLFHPLQKVSTYRHTDRQTDTWAF